MPTIDQLAPAVVAADDDHLLVSQNGCARRVTRSQLLAETQSALNLLPGLLGRSSAGMGPPEAIAIGAGLSLSGGVLTAAAPHSVATLSRSSSVTLDDRVAIWRVGPDQSTTVRELLSTGGVDIANQTASVGFGVSRQIGAWLGDHVSIEGFGAIGDGVTDDSHAFSLAAAAGRPILLGPKTYRVDGQWSISAPLVMIGVPGRSCIRRSVQNGGAWLYVSAPSFTAVGVSFDAGSLDGDSWGVLLGPTCTTSLLRDCQFRNATGRILGTGLTIEARDGVAGPPSSHTVMDCVFEGNSVHGLWIQAACGAEVRGCTARNNRGYGICLDFNDPGFAQRVRQSIVVNCRCSNNNRGISIGNYNENNLEPPRWGLENPDATDVTVAHNLCSENGSYGIAVSGNRLRVSGNHVSIGSTVPQGSGILCNASFTTITGNVVLGPGQFGIDAGGCADTAITDNIVEACRVGINAGGSLRGVVCGNKLIQNDRAVTIFQVETDGAGSNFGLPCSDIAIRSNTIDLAANQGGFFLIDGPEDVRVEGNRFYSQLQDIPADLCIAHTDTVKFEGNQWNGSNAAVVAGHIEAGRTQLTVSEIINQVVIDPATFRVDKLLRPRSAEISDQLTFIRVTNSGQGYTNAEVVVAGSGQGAAATAYIRDGSVVGVVLLSGGSGYDRASTTVAIVGDGQGATVVPCVGLPIGRNERLTLTNSTPVIFSERGTGELTNWADADILVPANSVSTCEGAGSGWRVTETTSMDYLRPGGDGSLTLVCRNGNLGLQAGPGFGVRTSSATEPAGYLSLFGRGSPEARVAAPPGSDYRNLDGGPGSTLWVKRLGVENSGWFAVA